MARHPTLAAKTRTATAGTDVPQGSRIGAFDAFERLQIEVIALEALANAANAAMDEYKVPPSAPRRALHRAHALVSDTALKAEALVRLAEDLKEAVVGRHEGGQDAQSASAPEQGNGRASRGSSAPRVRPLPRAAGRARARREPRSRAAPTARPRSSQGG